MLNLIAKGLKKTRTGIGAFFRDNRGVTAIEYAIVAVAVAAIVAGVFGRGGELEQALDQAFTKVSTTIESVGTNNSGDQGDQGDQGGEGE